MTLRLRHTLAAVALLAVASSAGAAGYPERTVSYIIPFGPGGESDISASTSREREGRPPGRS